MFELKKVNFFPRDQDYSIIYSDKSAFSRLFQNLYIQISPSNSFALRILKTRLVLFIRSFFAKEIDAPNSEKSFLGIKKPNKIIFFELENNNPIAVWRKNIIGSWDRSDFLGYQLVSEYSLKEFRRKKEIIKKALEIHWNLVLKDTSKVHGDLTHFNILVNNENEIHFIDQKTGENSKIFDFFYFYSYFRQCHSRCKTLSKDDFKKIFNEVDDILRQVCSYKNKSDLISDIEQMALPKVHGLNDSKSDIDKFLSIWKIEG